jgi:uncharacterized membrane protein
VGPERLRAFSDGVIAIIITIMVLDLKAPHESSLAALFALWTTFAAYVIRPVTALQDAFTGTRRLPG